MTVEGRWPVSPSVVGVSRLGSEISLVGLGGVAEEPPVLVVGRNEIILLLISSRVSSMGDTSAS